MPARLIFYVVAVLGASTILSLGAFADTKEIPFKIDEPTANRLAAEGADHRARPKDLWYEGEGRMSPPFFVYNGVRPPPAESGSFGFFAVNPWTGDVWALWGCKRLSTPALRKSQAEIRQRFTADELKQYPKLRRLQPRCITD